MSKLKKAQPVPDDREFLLETYRAALEAVDPVRLVTSQLSLRPGELRVGPHRRLLQGRIWLVAVGKAAVGMARAAVPILGERLSYGLVVAPTGTVPASLDARVEVLEGGHPLPDERSLKAGFRLVEKVRPAAEDVVLVLLSGGASAMMELPAPGLTLEDLRATTDSLMRRGARIGELNAVRKHLSLLKGGRLARRWHPARCVTLALSDVLGNVPGVIGSGPTLPDPSTFREVISLLQRRRARVPEPVRNFLRAGRRGEQPETPKASEACFKDSLFFVLGDNRWMAQGALDHLQRRRLPAYLLTTWLQGEAREVGRTLAAVAREIRQSGRPFPAPCCLVASGEPTVTVRGDGRGGRCQELALGFAAAGADLSGVSLLAAGSDGLDGCSQAAGALLDENTMVEAAARGLEPERYLATSDSHGFFREVGGLIVTGPSGTNANDLYLLLVR